MKQLFTKFLQAFLFMAVLVACAPSIQELMSIPPGEEFKVNANYLCLYTKAVEHVSSYLGWTEPKFQYHIDHNSKKGWLRQPLTLVEIYYLTENSSLIKVHRTISSQAFNQASELVTYLKSNPCR
jgi:hypothetical protein